MQDFIVAVINQYGYWGVCFLLVLENIILLIPSEIILAFGGFAATYTSMNVWGVILSATLGSVLGALILYGAGRFTTVEHLERLLAGKIGVVLRLRPDDISRANAWFARQGNLTVFICRFIPVIRCVISLPAGSAKMHLGVFLALTAAGTAIWNTVLVWFGVFAGKSWHSIVHYMNTYAAYTFLAAGLTVIAAVVYFRKRAGRKKQQRRRPQPGK